MGTNVVALIAIVLVLVLALISWKIDMIPRRLLALVKQERAREDGQAQTALLEAAAAKVGPVVAGIRAYHDQLEASLRAQLAEAETRARVSERRALDASTYLQAASTLVADLRNLREERALLVHGATVASAPAPEPSAESGDPDQRVTTEVRRRPASVSSPARVVAPPASAPILPAEPAMVAARLVSRAPSEPARPASRRTRTFSGASDARREDAVPLAPARIDLNDSADWMLSERPSDPDGERTRVGPRPSPESLGLPALKPTLLSMPSVAPSSRRPVPPVDIEGHPQGNPRSS